MSNLIEKTLLLGFGIFTLTIFTSLILPFLGEIADFNQNEKSKLENYMLFIEEVDRGINYVIENPHNVYFKNIDYPSNLNISFYDSIVKYIFLIDNQICVRINEYNHTFYETHYYQIPPQVYLLNITIFLSSIKVNLN
ncbi:MAG: hypothetical protein ACFE9Z_06155 [Promethearchaeota archaeon]